MGFKKVFQDNNPTMDFKHFAEFQGKLVTYALGPVPNDARIIGSDDGQNWETLVNIPQSFAGNRDWHDAGGMAIIPKGIYKDSLFVSLYNGEGKYKMLQVKPNLSIHGHLDSLLHNNYGCYDQEIWFNHHFVVTDVTPYISDRRVVYRDLAIACTNYGGAEYLNYGRADSKTPVLAIRHRATQLKNLFGQLYLFATRFNGTCWGWQVYRFNEENMYDGEFGNYDAFGKIFDSAETFSDGFILGAVEELNHRVYVVGVQITENGNPIDVAKIYVSTNPYTSSNPMEEWTEESVFPIFEDEFEDGIRDRNWTYSDGNGTIIEASDLLTLAVANGVNGDPSTANAPMSWMEPLNIISGPRTQEVVIEAKLNSYTVNDDTRAGLYITSAIAPGTGYYFTRYRNDSYGSNGLQVKKRGGMQYDYLGVTTMPVWLRIVCTGSGPNSRINFYHSIDGMNWHSRYAVDDYSWNYAGLVTGNWGVLNPITAPFEYFHVRRIVGYPVGSLVFKGRFLLSCFDIRDRQKIRYYREGLKRFDLEADLGFNV